MTLFPHIPLDPAETPLSFASRLAAIHTGGPAGPFLSDLGIRVDQFARGTEDTVRALCTSAGVAPEPLLAQTPVPLGERRYQLGQEVVSPDFLMNASTVFCPTCLSEDDAKGGDPARYRREQSIWKLRVARTCPHHGQPLTMRPKHGWTERLKGMALSVPERGIELMALGDKQSQRSVSPLQSYALDRLAGHSGPEWLDSQTLEQAVRSSEMLGAFVRFGAKAKVSEFTPDDWDVAGRVGFEATSRGEEGIREALGVLQETLTQIGRRPQHRNAFGQLHEWLGSRNIAKDPGDIRRIVREHIFDTVAVEPGKMVLGGCLTERRFHTVGTLADEFDLDPRTLRHVLAAKRLIALDDYTGTLEASVGREVAGSITRMVHVISLPQALNCCRPQATALIDEGILPVIATGQAGAPGRTQKAVDQNSIDAFLAELTEAAQIVFEVPAGMVPIAKAAEKAKLSAVEVVHLILGGFLSRVVCWTGEQGYSSVFVDPAEVKQLKRDVLVGVSVSKAAGMASLPVRTVWNLTDLNDGFALLPVISIKPLKGKRVIYRIRAEDVQAFRSQYLKANDVADHLECAIADAKRRLRPVRAALSEKEIGVNLYLREDLPDALRPVLISA